MGNPKISYSSLLSSREKRERERVAGQPPCREGKKGDTFFQTLSLKKSIQSKSSKAQNPPTPVIANTNLHRKSTKKKHNPLPNSPSVRLFDHLHTQSFISFLQVEWVFLYFIFYKILKTKNFKIFAGEDRVCH